MMNTPPVDDTSTETRDCAPLNKDWESDVKAYDAVYDHILHTAPDALSDGIVKQFPQKFGGAAVSTTGR